MLLDIHPSIYLSAPPLVDRHECTRTSSWKNRESESGRVDAGCRFHVDSLGAPPARRRPRRRVVSTDLGSCERSTAGRPESWPDIEIRMIHPSGRDVCSTCTVHVRLAPSKSGRHRIFYFGFLKPARVNLVIQKQNKKKVASYRIFSWNANPVQIKSPLLLSISS